MLRRSTIISLLIPAISICAGAVLAEGAVRIYSAVDEPLGAAIRGIDPMAVQIEPHGQLGYRQRPNAAFHYPNGTVASSNSMGFRGPTVALLRPPGTVRIILLGGSTSHGWGVRDDQTIDAHMRVLLRERFPNRQFEVVNLGFDGYDSYQDLQRLESDGLRLQPSVVIANTGINDVRNAWFPNLREVDSRTLIWETVLRRLRAERERGGPSLWTRIKHYSLLARIPGYLRDQIQRKRELRQRLAHPTADGSRSGIRPAGALAVPGKPPYPEAAAYFERNVRQIVALSIHSGAAVLLSTPASALRSYADTATSVQSYWVYDAKTTQGYRDELSRRLREITSDEQAMGRAVRYVAPNVPKSLFLDDCHLTSDGNRVVAETFIDAMMPLLTQVRVAADSVP